VLKLKPNCECCDVDLPADSEQAYMCSIECTFCVFCAEQNFNNICPNCGGKLVKRATRPAKYLEKYPAAVERYINEKHAGYPNFAGSFPTK